MDADLFQIERIASNKIKWKSGQKEKIVELYLEGKSLREIGALFGGLNKNTIKKILNDNGIKLRTLSQSRIQDNRNEYIFSTIDTEEKAYWLGFLAADGCISGNYIIISLQAKDKNHLEKFKAFLNVESASISTYLKKDTKGIAREYCRFSIGCKQMAEDLKKVGCVENKSLILMPPENFIPEEFYLDWIRGYFDGDGGLNYSKKDNRWQSYMNSTKEVLSWIVKILNLNTKPFNQQHYGKLDNVWRIHFNGRYNVYNALNKIYRNNNATVYLDRKYEKYIQLRSSIINTVNLKN